MGATAVGGADVPAEQRFADLESTLAQMNLDPAENAPLLAPLFDIPLPQERAPAFVRARELAATIDGPTERFAIYYGLWIGNTARREWALALEIARTFLREAEREIRTTECAVGRRLVGFTCLWQGDFITAQANLVEALSICDAARDREARFRFGGISVGLRKPTSPRSSGSSGSSDRRAPSWKKPSPTRSKPVTYRT
jgi:hypothetical protein